MASPPYATSPLAMSPPNPSPAQLPNKKRSSTLDVNAPPIKRRKASNLSQSSVPSHPLRQTSFPPEAGRSPYARSPSVDVASIVSGSAISATAGGATKKKRGRKSKNAKGDDAAERTPSLVGGKAPTTVSGQGGDKEAEDDDDDDENGEMALEDAGARTQEQKQEEIRLRAMLVEAFDSEQYNRYELWRAAKLSDAVVKRVVNATVSQSVPQMVSTAVKAVAKLFAGEIIEAARNVQGEWITAGEKQADLPTPPPSANDVGVDVEPEEPEVKRGPLRPDHLREAWRRYKICGESRGQNSTEPSQSAAAVRIRDNQRRSRARRKEYVENLELKVQEYEKQGVGATLEMQHAARTVAMENSRLRMMLALTGATEADIEAFLQSCQDREAAEALSSVSLRPMHHGQQEQKSSAKNGGSWSEAPPRTQDGDAASVQESEDFQAQCDLDRMATTVTSAASSTCDMSFKAEPEYFAPRPESKPHSFSCDRRQNQQSMAGFDFNHGYGLYSSFGSATPTPTPTPGSSPFDKLDVLASATLQQGSCCEGKTQCTTAPPLPTPASEAPSPSTIEPSTGAVTPLSSCAPELFPGASTVVQDFSSPMEMSCNAAAAIIAEMQGNRDREIAKSRLGCRGRNDCFVRNTMLFQMLESESGGGQYS
ncbi:hypothetical protein C2857_004365 [Epichloe festucae Fl1]|uniref:TAFII28-like protein domain-containing protein n=1 Tax=Epichloe festucae (strain Fl1) TaxID=877507 RepID=A0A7S9KP42_EPIFF|nr:hypothetical protein C2857_004365 [Epichloe festucae Fl1]